MTERERERYSRQILFAGLGEKGQSRLLAARATVVGCGALGTVQVDALARAGVGEITVIDRDYVEESNLQRQWLFDEQDAAEALPKAVAAARKISRVNSSTRVEARVADLHAGNVEELIGRAEVVLDGTDNFETRYLVNEVCVKRGIPWIYGAAVGSYGVTMPILPGRSACLACVFPEPPGGAQPTCDTAGVLNAVTAAVAAWQVADALKFLSGRSDLVVPRLLSFDMWDGEPRTLSVARANPRCRVCGERRFERLEAGASGRAAVLCGRGAVQIPGSGRPHDLAGLAVSLARLGEVKVNDYALRFRLPPREMTLFSDGRAIIKGAADPAAARAFYARYVGG